MIGRVALLLGVLLVLLANSGASLAAPEVDLYGRVLTVEGRSLALDVDGARVVLDVSEIDARFVAALRPGDDVHVAAFRLEDGSLLVYGLFLQARDAPAPRPTPTVDPEGE